VSLNSSWRREKEIENSPMLDENDIHLVLLDPILPACSKVVTPLSNRNTKKK